jgi:2'-5' RNA ligase
LLANNAVKLTELQLFEAEIDGLETGILWLNVEETDILRKIHNRVNQEFTTRFGDVQAPFDGPEYHFHMTVAIGNQPIEIIRR